MLIIFTIRTFGRVSLVKDRKTGLRFALKMIKHQIHPITRGIDRHLAENEIFITGSLHHPRVINLYRAFNIPNGTFVDLVLELAEGGSVQSFVDLNAKRLKEEHIAHILKEILEGLAYIHERGVIHRDIKPLNVLLTREGHVKIADFGLSTVLDSPRARATRIWGTPWYMDTQMKLPGGYGCEVDIYALGRTAEHLRTTALALPNGCSFALLDFIRLCTQDRSRRPKAPELLKVCFDSLADVPLC
ncbi:hypothetical protein BOTBODRAFT_116825 [Botryobasidium botryosum FD-172 SS1]|uniref:Protein kinase domain-containing protein n=1 Tax=Botryobasidium botryosum (strain FD-172 SS1) TaxID=930990 RepID=A0A067M4X9_BOTB1|nr:hypothetical protein BOTBODRAFT_116825 [Botryobasidium botryosum FD-172 SS1]